MTYSVKEIFYTLQGEGGQAGMPAVFCRFAGCNLWSGREADRAGAICRFCDTEFVGTDGTLGGKYADASALAAVRFIEGHPERVRTLHENSHYFRQSLLSAGLKPLAGETPIVPIIIGDTADAIRMSEMLLNEGIFVTGFGFPVVPRGAARLRCQVSSAHTRTDLDYAVTAISKIARQVGVLT